MSPVYFIDSLFKHKIEIRNSYLISQSLRNVVIPYHTPSPNLPMFHFPLPEWQLYLPSILQCSLWERIRRHMFGKRMQNASPLPWPRIGRHRYRPPRCFCPSMSVPPPMTMRFQERCATIPETTSPRSTRISASSPHCTGCGRTATVTTRVSHALPPLLRLAGFR